MDTCPIVRVKPWSKDQGDFVEINLADFDHDKHQVYEGDDVPAAPVQADEASEEAPAPKPAPAKHPAKRRNGR
jgi:hypothetical protein